MVFANRTGVETRAAATNLEVVTAWEVMLEVRCPCGKARAHIFNTLNPSPDLKCHSKWELYAELEREGFEHLVFDPTVAKSKDVQPYTHGSRKVSW